MATIGWVKHCEKGLGTTIYAAITRLFPFLCVCVCVMVGVFSWMDRKLKGILGKGKPCLRDCGNGVGVF